MQGQLLAAQQAVASPEVQAAVRAQAAALSDPKVQAALQAQAQALATPQAQAALRAQAAQIGQVQNPAAELAMMNSVAPQVIRSQRLMGLAMANVDSVDVIDATHAIVHLDVPANGALGYRNVTMTTGTQTAALHNGLYVSPVITAPVVTGVAPQTVFSGVNRGFNLGSFSAGGSGPWTVRD